MSKKRSMNKKMSPKEKQRIRRKKRRRKRLIILIVELIILAALCAVAYGMLKLDMLDIKMLDQEKLEVYRDTGPYTNIALFGLDSREGELEGGASTMRRMT